MKLLSILIKLAPFATISLADAKRFDGRSPYKTEGRAERHLDTELSMPGPKKGVDETGIPDTVAALDISGAKMSSGPARVVCSTILNELFDLLLFSREEEEAIKIIVCGEEEEDEEEEEEETCDGISEGNECNFDVPCCDGLVCTSPDSSPLTCQPDE
mmetsp:Transcript_3453/g.8768  ORF Transcript_3453/g.8768 Transcript_3453/m.8768 type:complete len:158 (-) Transcript_3453:188-661(-)